MTIGVTGGAWNPLADFARNGQQTIPASVIPSNNQYTFQCKIDAAPDCTYGVAVISAYDTATKRHTVSEPGEDSASPAICVFLGGAIYEADELISGCLGPTRPIIARYDTSAEPAIGEDIGTEAGSWKLLAGKTGFVCVGIVDATEGLCLVRVAGGGGGTLPLKLVQVQNDGKVKDIVFTENPSTDTPNFTTPGASYSVFYVRA